MAADKKRMMENGGSSLSRASRSNDAFLFGRRTHRAAHSMELRAALRTFEGAAAACAFLMAGIFCANALAAGEYDPSFDLWPLVRYWASPEKSERCLEALGPILEWRDSPAADRFYVRPLYNRRDDKSFQVVESEAPWPIGFGTGRPDLSRTAIYPLFLRDREKLSDGGTQSRIILIPLLYQRSGKGPNDLFIFPFGGVVHNILDRKKVVIALWPIYVYQEGKEAESWSVLHPIFTYVQWEDGGRGYKFWPLFGVNRRPEKLSKTFVLWPIYHSQYMKNDLGEFRRWWIFPFYGRIDDPSGWEWTVLWPFFGQRHEQEEKTSWYPWPVLGRRTGPEVSGWVFWPVYSTESRPGKKRVGFLWPLGWRRWAEKPDDLESSFRLIPLTFIEQEKRGKVESGAWQAWPLVKRSHEPDGSSCLEVPSLFPARSYAPWERNFAPFFRLFEYRRSADGTKSWSALWRLIRLDTGAADRYVEVAPVFDLHVRRTEEPKVRWSILKGLIGYEGSPEAREYRFLYFMTLLTSGYTKEQAAR